MPFVLLILCSFNLENIHLKASEGCVNGNGCARLLADECAADGGHIRDLKLCGGCLIGAYDNVGKLHIVLLVKYGYGRTYRNDGGVDLAFIDDDSVLDLILEFFDTSLNSRLFCSRLIVLGVLGEACSASLSR